MHCLSAQPYSNLLVKSLLTTSSSTFNSSAIILMSTWRHFSHKSPHLSHIFITLQCYGTVRSLSSTWSLLSENLAPLKHPTSTSHINRMFCGGRRWIEWLELYCHVVWLLRSMVPIHILLCWLITCCFSYFSDTTGWAPLQYTKPAKLAGSILYIVTYWLLLSTLVYDL